MNKYSQTKPDLRMLLLDVWPKINEVRANPTRYGFTVTTIGALDDPALADKSFTGPGADYLYWDFHGTSKLHKLIASWHLDVLTNSILEKLEVQLTNGSAMIAMSHLLIGRDYTLQNSSDLTSWNDVQTFTASAGINQVSQALETGTRSAFYRLQWQQ